MKHEPPHHMCSISGYLVKFTQKSGSSRFHRFMLSIPGSPVKFTPHMATIAPVVFSFSASGDPSLRGPGARARVRAMCPSAGPAEWLLFFFWGGARCWHRQIHFESAVCFFGRLGRNARVLQGCSFVQASDVIDFRKRTPGLAANL